MSIFRITIANKDFSSTSDSQATDASSAALEATRGAIGIGADEVCGGEPFFGAEIIIEHNGIVIERRIISIGSSPLTMATDQGIRIHGSGQKSVS
jgi:hypothetical protein